MGISAHNTCIFVTIDFIQGFEQTIQTYEDVESYPVKGF